MGDFSHVLAVGGQGVKCRRAGGLDLIDVRCVAVARLHCGGFVVVLNLLYFDDIVAADRFSSGLVVLAGLVDRRGIARSVELHDISEVRTAKLVDRGGSVRAVFLVNFGRMAAGAALDQRRDVAGGRCQQPITLQHQRRIVGAVLRDC